MEGERAARASMTSLGCSATRLPDLRITMRMHHSEDNHLGLGLAKEDPVREAAKQCTPRVTPDARIGRRGATNGREDRRDRAQEFEPEAGGLLVVPPCRGLPISRVAVGSTTRRRSRGEITYDGFRCCSRSRISASTSSHGRAASGCASDSVHRRSSSAASSGVIGNASSGASVAIESQRSATSCKRSGTLRRRSASKSISELAMAIICGRPGRARKRCWLEA